MSIVALRARDGHRLWWTSAGRIGARLHWTRLLAGLRIALGQFSLVGAWQAMRDVRLDG